MNMIFFLPQPEIGLPGAIFIIAEASGAGLPEVDTRNYACARKLGCIIGISRMEMAIGRDFT
jgi:hypothetical protein